MDEVLKVVKERRSIRSFLKKDITEDLVKKLIEALIWAPSAGNLQARKFYFIKNKEIKIKLAQASLSQMFIADAPLVIIGCIDKEKIYSRYGERGVNLYAIQDVACSITNAMLVAHENGLGTVWVGAFREEEVSKILELPKHLRPVVIMPVGYPGYVPSTPSRVSIHEAIEFIE
ncbi:nitroreductase family protein [Thermodesulfovibrio yellowstonii]|uniref:NADH dehydrogenase n=1 Tax=Thermodesulfovibrio yellowstonii TaxID=28262 RepID=A0A9W6GGM1_9BACT|nr:nitroreductase family protein [Thermodesulfovibrio islandicus]GLI53587.1 NADH dehydrogenase [Thermodesulfovibrio islandicus]